MTTELSSWYENIGPDRAADLLKLNRHNRPINKQRVSELVACILNGEWKVTHQGVCISESNALIDGQHRLLAIVQSGVAVMMLVTAGVPDEAQLIIDTGQPRSTAQNVGLMGYTYSKWVTAWTNLARVVVTNSQSFKFSPAEVIRVYEELGAAVTFGTTFGKHSAMSRAPVGAAMLITYNTAPKKVEAFFKAFEEGAGIEKGTAVYSARQYYFQSSARARDDRAVVAGKIVRCVNLHIREQTVDSAHLYVQTKALMSFAKGHPETTLFGQLFKNRAERLAEERAAREKATSPLVAATTAEASEEEEEGGDGA